MQNFTTDYFLLTFLRKIIGLAVSLSNFVKTQWLECFVEA